LAKFEEKGGKLFIDGKQVLHGWESFSGWYWFATELVQVQDSVIGGKTYEGDNIWHGLVQGAEEEWGDFSESELRSLTPKVWRIPYKALPWRSRQ
jgi:hypothetical protein